MSHPDPRVDAYIAAAAPFARPVLAYLREQMHRAAPALVEDIKWGMPFFVLDGRPLAHMAAFKQHCAFGFWRGREVVDTGREGEAMGQFGRIGARAELPPPREFQALVRAAVARQAVVVAAPPTPRRAVRPPPPLPDELAAALDRVPAARAHFEALATSHRREYLEWVLTAKRAETRQRRIAQTVERLAQGLKRP